MGRKETDRRFLQLAEQGVAATLQGVQDKIAKEEAAERNRPGASSGSSGMGAGSAGDSSSYASLSGILGVDSFGKVPTLSFSVAPRAAAAAAATAVGGAAGEERGGGGDDDQQ